ncbi:hypothetical protein CCM_05823 [Cordyceps militaris CM01]|uniref:Uncharacterized protein n=2 Tax=Cordyceps militaris TaxID=73501 RepID=G3JHA9_CORMM|nr:uncharacterized protein CCM_05823 [Cordyceps militaris CM01]ATY59447.1 hypothetical protein A9K55_003194 [Cordyceps militaris]EGX91665.1 hypothetical protein CCM_05823 [Cordyceps militaris CM01]
MSTFRPVARLFALGLAPAACVGASFALRKPVKFDALQPAPVSQQLRRRGEVHSPDRLSPRIIEQLSRGSILGFGAGVVIAFFSRTLVFLSGLVAGSLQVDCVKNGGRRLRPDPDRPEDLDRISSA